MFKYEGKETFVKVNGSSIYTKFYGDNKDKPTIVLDAGYGDYSNTWDGIVSQLRGHANVLVYDRPGLGKSEPSERPRTSLEMSKELKVIFDILNINTPVVLVGHSFGGVNAQLYVSCFPKDVAGLVLIDATPADYKERFLPTMKAEFQEAYHKQFILEGTYEEFMESLNQLSKVAITNIPTIILVAGKKAHYTMNSQKLWLEMQKEMLEIAQESELIIAKNSTHYIQNDEPELVIDAINQLISN